MIRHMQIPDHTIAFITFTHLIKTRLFDQITGKQHACLYTMGFQILYHMIFIHTFAAGNEKTKPRWL